MHAEVSFGLSGATGWHQFERFALKHSRIRVGLLVITMVIHKKAFSSFETLRNIISVYNSLEIPEVGDALMG